jgi:hypothetical protein
LVLMRNSEFRIQNSERVLPNHSENLVFLNSEF